MKVIATDDIVQLHALIECVCIVFNLEREKSTMTFTLQVRKVGIVVDFATILYNVIEESIGVFQQRFVLMKVERMAY